MNYLIRYIVFSLLLPVALACAHRKMISSNYTATAPRLYFYADSLLIETDTTALMPLLRQYYSAGRVHTMQSELIYRIQHSPSDSVWMDGLSMNLYLDEKRNAFECAVINHNEVISLVKNKKTAWYLRNSHRVVHKIMIQRSGSKRKNHIDETYFDAHTGQQLLKRNIYTRTECRPPTLKNS